VADSLPERSQFKCLRNAPGLFVARHGLRQIVYRIQICRVRRTESRDIDHNGLSSCQGETRHATGLGVEAAQRQRLCDVTVSDAAIAEVPGALHNDGRTFIAMRVRLDCGAGRNLQANGVEPWFRRVTPKYGRVNSSQPKCKHRRRWLHGCNLARCQANLIDCRRLRQARQYHDQKL
jgi:hypothetical protein